MDEFVLKINLGNEAMEYPEHVADVLRKLADKIDNKPEEGVYVIFDENGNKVGKAEFK